MNCSFYGVLLDLVSLVFKILFELFEYPVIIEIIVRKKANIIRFPVTNLERQSCSSDKVKFFQVCFFLEFPD